MGNDIFSDSYFRKFSHEDRYEKGNKRREGKRPRIRLNKNIFIIIAIVVIILILFFVIFNSNEKRKIERTAKKHFDEYMLNRIVGDKSSYSSNIINSTKTDGFWIVNIRYRIAVFDLINNKTINITKIKDVKVNSTSYEVIIG